MKVIIITPILHLKNVFNEIGKYIEIVYKPYINKIDLGDLLERNSDIQYIFTNPNKQGFILDKTVLENTNIKVINTASTGTNHIDKEYCFNNNIKIWSLTKDYGLINNLPSTSELAFGLMINLLRYIPQSFNDVKNLNWNYEKFIGRQIKGLNLGIIGFGRLGKMMANFGHSFGMNIYIYDPYIQNVDNNYNLVNLDQLCSICDVISLHVHVTDETKNMVNKDFLNKMKKNSYLINTSRGEIVNEDDIIESIKNFHLFGYGTDVIINEFDIINESKLIKLSQTNQYNILITPHIGGMTIEGQNKAFMWAAQKFKDI